jgi:hypothetical protein
LPSQTAHRAALPDLGLSEQFSIAVSSLYYRRCLSIILFTAALHEPVRLSNGCNLIRSRSAAQLNIGNRRTSKGRHGTIRRFRRAPLKPITSAMGQTETSPTGAAGPLPQKRKSRALFDHPFQRRALIQGWAERSEKPIALLLVGFALLNPPYGPTFDSRARPRSQEHAVWPHAPQAACGGDGSDYRADAPP